jgi:hypothetical protein
VRLPPRPHSESKLTPRYRRSAAEIDELYENRVPAWRWKKTVTQVEKQLQAALQVRSGEKDAAAAIHSQGL